MATREVLEGKQTQGVDEKVTYTFSTTPWGGTPTNAAMVVKVVGTYADVTSAVAVGSPNIVGDVITLPKIQSLTLGKVYRVEVKFDSGGNTLECFFFIKCEL